MKHQIIKPTSQLNKNLCCGVLSLLCTINWAQSQTKSPPSGDAMLVGEQFSEVHNQIREIQLKATETKAVKKAQAKFSEAMNQAMLKADPEIEKDLKRSNELLAKIRAHPDIDNPQAREQNMELKKMLLDYRYLERKLTPARKLAAEEPKCKEQLEKLEEVTLTEMKKINPDTQALMDKKETLAARYRELRKTVN